MSARTSANPFLSVPLLFLLTIFITPVLKAADDLEATRHQFSGGFAYWGKVSYNLELGQVIHHVEGSPMIPAWVGGDNVRYFEFDGDLLKVSLKNAQGRVTGTLTWRRLQ